MKLYWSNPHYKKSCSTPLLTKFPVFFAKFSDPVTGVASHREEYCLRGAIHVSGESPSGEAPQLPEVGLNLRSGVYHRKTMGKTWENHGKTMGKWWFHGIWWDLPSNMACWKMDHRSETFRNHKASIQKPGIFLHAMFDWQRVSC